MNFHRASAGFSSERLCFCAWTYKFQKVSWGLEMADLQLHVRVAVSLEVNIAPRHFLMGCYFTLYFLFLQNGVLVPRVQKDVKPNPEFLPTWWRNVETELVSKRALLVFEWVDWCIGECLPIVCASMDDNVSLSLQVWQTGGFGSFCLHCSHPAGSPVHPEGKVCMSPLHLQTHLFILAQSTVKSEMSTLQDTMKDKIQVMIIFFMI